MGKVNFIEIKLEYPIEVKDNKGEIRTMETLRFGRLKAKHLSLLPEGLSTENSKVSPTAMIPIIAGLAGLSTDEAGEIDMADITVIADRLPEIMGEPQSQVNGKN